MNGMATSAHNDAQRGEKTGSRPAAAGSKRRQKRGRMAHMTTARAILLGGATVAVVDGLDAFLFWKLYRGVPGLGVFRGVMVGALGPAAREGGLRTGLLGLAVHALVAFSVVAAFVLLSRALPALRRPWLLWGPLYGLAVYCFMYYVVMPATPIGWPPFRLVPFINNILIHMLGVGLPAAYFASRVDPA
jgi:hypothetical protein